MKNISATMDSNDSNNTSSQSMSLPSKVEGIAWCSAFALEAFLIVAGNLFTIVLFAVNKKLRKKSIFLVINMAFADLMSGAVSLPIFIYTAGAGQFMLWTATLNKTLITFHFIVQTVFLQASLLSAALISCERFHAIYWPFKHRTLSMRAYRIVIFMVWILAILVLTLNYLISNKLAFYTFMSILLALLFIVCGCNIAIWRKFQRGRPTSQQQNRAAQNQRLTKTLLFVSIVALLSWLPLIIYQLLYFAFEVRIPFRPFNIFFMALALNYSNFFLNPMIYVLRIPEFRQALGLCCRRSLVATNREDKETRNNQAVVLTPMTQLTTLSTNSSHLELVFEQDVMDTKL